MVNLCTVHHQSGTGFDDDDPDNCMTSIQQSTVLESEYSDFRRVYSGAKYDVITTVVKRQLCNYHFNDEAKDIRRIFCMNGM